MRLGNGKIIAKARKPAANPLAFIGRFFAQPRLIAGWLFAVVRSCGWWVYVVYMPIFAVEAGLGDKIGGTLLSMTNAVLFTTPLMLRWMQRRTIRTAVRIGFFACGTTFVLATLAASQPYAALGILFIGSSFLILLDIAGGLPFLLAVKPSERTEMSAVYSSFRDVSGIATPGIAWLVLLAFPLSGVFAAIGVTLFAAWALAGKQHPQIGIRASDRGRKRTPEINCACRTTDNAGASRQVAVLRGLAAQRLAHAVNAAAGPGEHGHVRVVNLETGGTHLCIQLCGAQR